MVAVHTYSVEDDAKKPLPKKKKVAPKAVQEKDGKKKVKRERVARAWTLPFRSIGGYFKGAWQELRQVRWPNRKATWGLTLAVILFSLALGGIIFVLDIGFSYLFKEIIL